MCHMGEWLAPEDGEKAGIICIKPLSCERHAWIDQSPEAATNSGQQGRVNLELFKMTWLPNIGSNP